MKQWWNETALLLRLVTHILNIIVHCLILIYCTLKRELSHLQWSTGSFFKILQPPMQLETPQQCDKGQLSLTVLQIHYFNIIWTSFITKLVPGIITDKNNSVNMVKSDCPDIQYQEYNSLQFIMKSWWKEKTSLKKETSWRKKNNRLNTCKGFHIWQAHKSVRKRFCHSPKNFPLPWIRLFGMSHSSFMLWLFN